MKIRFFFLSWISVLLLAFSGFSQECPELLSHINTPGDAEGVYYLSGLIFVADGVTGLRIIDLGDGYNPEEVGNIDTTGYAYGVTATRSYAFLADGPAGISIMDITDKYHPSIIGSFDTPGTAYNLMYLDNILYVADGDSGIVILDVLDPAHPALLSSFDTPGEARDIKVSGEFAYIADGYSGLRIVNISNLSSPVEVGSYEPDSYCSGIAIINDTVYLADRTYGIHEIDVSTPAVPKVDNTHETEGTAMDVSISEYGIFVADGTSGITALGKNTYNTPGTAKGVDSRFKFAIIADGEYGVYIFNVSYCNSYLPNIYYIPAAAQKAGGADSNWVSDVVLHNPGVETADTVLYYLLFGEDNSGVSGIEQAITAQQSIKWMDVVQTFFSKPGTSGAIRIDSSRPLIVTSRTYNDLAIETFGQYIPGFSLQDSLRQDDEGRLVQMTENTRYRTNVGFVNTSNLDIQIDITLFYADGTEIGVLHYPLKPYEYFQQGNILRQLTSENIDNYYAILTSSSPGARFFAYASVIDWESNDAVYIPAMNIRLLD